MYAQGPAVLQGDGPIEASAPQRMAGSLYSLAESVPPKTETKAAEVKDPKAAVAEKNEKDPAAASKAAEEKGEKQAQAGALKGLPTGAAGAEETKTKAEKEVEVSIAHNPTP